MIITGSQFTAWQKAMGYSGAAAARALGLSPNTIGAYRRKGTDKKLVVLAMKALYAKVDQAKWSWEEE